MAQGLVYGISIRLELTRVCSLNGFQLVMGLIEVTPLFFFKLEIPVNSSLIEYPISKAL